MGAAVVPLVMDAVDLERDPDLIAVAELLRRHRSTMTFDERERVNSRLHAAATPGRRSRVVRSRLASIVLVCLGLVFTTGGTGLAMSGFATVGPAVRAQYPDQTAPGSASNGTAGGPSSGAPGTAGSHGQLYTHGGSADTTSRPPRTFSQVPPMAQSGTTAYQSGTTAYVGLQRAETHGDLPFTGFEALPILGAGIALLLAGGVLSRSTRRTQPG